jgi:hypothetical protein
LPPAILSKLHGIKHKSSGGWVARCPAHDDRDPSLSIDERDGKTLLHCMSGCTPDAVVSAVGLTLADLMGDQPATAKRLEWPATVDSLARAKGLPVEILTRYGVKDVSDMTEAEKLSAGVNGSSGVWIPYYNADGTIAGRTRIRQTLDGKDRFRWAGGVGSPQAYGIQDLEDARREGILCLCEGETDYWSLRAMGVPAIGIPGAQAVRALPQTALAGVQTAYICQDSDPAGASFASTLGRILAGWGVPTIAVVRMPPDCKDVNDLYRKDPATALERFGELLSRAAAAAVPRVREFSAAHEIYTLTVPEWGFRLELDQTRWKWSEFVGELAVIPDDGADWFRGSINLSSVERRQGVAREIEKRSGHKDVGWADLIEDFSIRCLRQERIGRPAVNLADLALPPADDLIVVDGIRLERQEACCIFGDGGTGKSLLSLYILGTLARNGVQCGYIDAETHSGAQRRRLGMLFGEGALPQISYMLADRPLVHLVDHLRRWVRDHRLQYVVLDSVAMLTAGEPEKAEAANGYFGALRRLGIGSLSIAHVTKNGENNQQKPFGSAFYHNNFRLTWNIQRTDQDSGSTVKAIGLWNRKYNNGPEFPPMGFEVVGEEGRVRYVRRDLAELDGFAEKLPTARRIAALLKRGPMTPDAISEDLGLTVNAVRVALSKGKRAGKLVQIPTGGTPAWGIAADESEAA